MDVLLAEATELVVRCQFASAAMLQRRLQIGFGLACQLLDAMHVAGIVGEHRSGGPRQVLYGNTEVDAALVALARSAGERQSRLIGGWLDPRTGQTGVA